MMHVQRTSFGKTDPSGRYRSTGRLWITSADDLIGPVAMCAFSDFEVLSGHRFRPASAVVRRCRHFVYNGHLRNSPGNRLVEDRRLGLGFIAKHVLSFL